MWRIILTLALASTCLALPSAQQNNGTLDGLSHTTPSAVSKPAENPNVETVLSSTVLDVRSTTPTTSLGTQNKSTSQDCECVPYYMCRNETIIVDGVGFVDVRNNPCKNYLEVCCKPPDMVKIQDNVTPPPPVRRGCGDRHPSGVGFSITGHTDNEAQFAEFPWMVVIVKESRIVEKNKTAKVYQCGGSLIHRQAVLTAAHCVYGKEPSKLKIRAGEWDTQTDTEIYPHQDRTVRSVIVHEEFNAQALSFDVAILILSEPVNITENVDVVCLSEQNAVYDGSRCFASGWGKDKFGKEGLYQSILQKVDLPVVPRDTCQDSLRKTRLGKYFQLHESFICAGGEKDKDTCKGDGGSPLVCPSKDDPTRYQQVGIVAWGVGCDEDGIPGVYANVAHVRDWIDKQMASNALDNTVYTL